MSHPLAQGAALGLLLTLAGGVARAFDPPHDATNAIECRDCHASHSDVDPLLPRDLDQDVVCKSCHNPTGQAASMADVALHNVNGGTTIVDCGSCHDPHRRHASADPHPGGVTADNRSLVRADTAKYVPAALEPAVFQQRPQHFAFATGSAPYDGICQSCHTETAYHRNDGSADQGHNVGMDCTFCHRHDKGFLPSSCTDCHALAQDNGDGTPSGGRRAMVGEYPVGTSHAHLRQSPVSDADCLVCHDVATHADGRVDLLDPDTGALVTFERPSDLASDPDLSTFCARCHDADGAARLATPLDPFASGFAPPEVASRFAGTLAWNEWYGDWCFGSEGTLRLVNSHHDLSDADQAASGAKLECLSCHGAHNPSAGQKLADPDDTTQPWAGTTTNFCLRCHAGGEGPTDTRMPAGVETSVIRVDPSGVPCDNPSADCSGGFTLASGLRPFASCEYVTVPYWTSYTWAHSAHGGDSKRGWAGYSDAPGAEVDCTVCHDPHGSYSATNPAGNPYAIRDVVDGKAFVDDGVRPGPSWTGPPWNTFGATREVIVTVTPGANPPPGGSDPASVDWGGATGLCSTCHAQWLEAYDWHAYCGGCQTCHGHGQDWENHDWGGGNNSFGCQACGNGVLEGVEACDDGNKVDGDGCSNECTNE
ncbi:MAG: hypothetical protein IT373_36480 [Polyangiaceae bacterium]|nr:hypothetical protein [Polyangiaceae bacterium]